MQIDLHSVIEEALDDLKAKDIKKLDVTNISDVTDCLIIATGTSSRHVKALANNVVEECKEKEIRPIGVEGLDAGDWVLVDYGDTVVHIMQQSTRDFYDLEKLWTKVPSHRSHDDAQQDDSH